MERYDAICEAIDGECDEATEQELAKLDAEMDAIRGADVYADEDRAVAGVFVSIDHDGTACLRRGFIRSEDDPRRHGDGEEETGEQPAKKKSPDALSASLSRN